MIRSIARTYHAAFTGLSRDLWLLSTVLLINRAGTMVLPFISLYLTQERGFSVAVAGRVLALYGLGAMAGSYLGGWLSDRIGTIRTLEASLITSGVGYLALAALRDLAAISAAVFLLSVVAEAFRPAAMAAVAQRAPAGLQVRAFALLRLAANLGMGIGPAVGGFLALVSYRWLFVADAATCWLALVILAVSRVSPDASAAERKERGAGASPWRDGPFLLLMLLVASLATVFFQVFSTLPVYFRRDCGFRENTIGLLLGFNAALIVMFEMVLVHWVERRQHMFVVGLGSFLICAGFALMPLGSSVAFIALTVAVWTLGEMLALPMMNAVVAGRAGPENRGRYMGSFTMAFSVAFVFAPAAGTWIYDHFGPDPLWYGIGVVGLLLWTAAVALIPALRRKPASIAPPA